METRQEERSTDSDESRARHAPEGTRPGAWEVDGGRVRFALWAPGKERVALVGDFNDWNADTHVLEVGEDGVGWLELELEPGVYAYQFQFGDGTRTGDPYAREVDWNEDGPNAVIRVGGAPFTWTDGDYQMQPIERWVIYEAHVGTMTSDGTFEALAEKLDYLHDLGVNALQLLPIFEFPGDRSWGYDPVYFLAPARVYGTPEAFMALVDAAHARGIAVILDIVFNHVAPDHPFTQMYPEGDNPFLSDEENDWGFPSLDHGSDAVKGFVHEVQRYWLDDMHVDGFRYDATAQIGTSETDGVAFIAHDARETQPHAHLIAEQIPEDPQLVDSTEIDAAWHDSWHHLLKAQLREGPYKGAEYGDMEGVRAALDPRSSGYRGALEVVNYLENHDQERVVAEIQSNPDAAPRALERSLLGAAVLFTAPGTPMVWMGQEFATDIPTQDSMDGAELGWDAFEDDGVAWLRDGFRRLVWLRREHPALATDRVDVWLADAESRVLAYRRSVADQDAEVIVIANFSPDEQGFEIDLPRGGRYHEVLGGDDWELEGGAYQATVPGSTARVLKRVAEADAD